MKDSKTCNKYQVGSVICYPYNKNNWSDNSGFSSVRPLYRKATITSITESFPTDRIGIDTTLELSNGDIRIIKK